MDRNETGVVVALTGAVVGGVAGVVAAGRALVRARRRIGELEWLLAGALDAPAADPAREPAATVTDVASAPPTPPTGSPRDDLVDPDTGLLDARYFHVAMEQRVAAARRKLQPLAVMLVDVDVEADSDLDFVQQTAVIHETLREADTICRIGPHRLGLILEEATEFGAVFAIERIRMSVNRAGGNEEHLWAGVAGYPSHALDAPQLLERAETALERARNSGKGWVRVARSE